MPLFENQEPQKGPKVESWTHLEVVGGAKVFGAWKAGPAVWINTHNNGRSVPCNPLITKGQVECRYDHSVFRLDLIGYVPIYIESGKRHFVIVREYSRPLVDAIPTYCRVWIDRKVGKFESVCVVADERAARWKPKKTDKPGGVDITPWLLRLWKDAELLAYFAPQLAAMGAEQVPQCDPPPEDKRAKKLSPEETTRRSVEVIRSNLVVKPQDDLPPIGEWMPNFTKNGKHPPPSDT